MMQINGILFVIFWIDLIIFIYLACRVQYFKGETKYFEELLRSEQEQNRRLDLELFKANDKISKLENEHEKGGA